MALAFRKMPGAPQRSLGGDHQKHLLWGQPGVSRHSGSCTRLGPSAAPSPSQRGCPPVPSQTQEPLPRPSATAGPHPQNPGCTRGWSSVRGCFCIIGAVTRDDVPDYFCRWHSPICTRCLQLAIQDRRQEALGGEGAKGPLGDKIEANAQS